MWDLPGPCPLHWGLILLFSLFIFNWGVIALQSCVGFYHLPTWTFGRYTCVFSFLNLLFTPVLCAQSLSRVQLFVTPWTTAHQAPLSMGFSRQEYWRGLPCPPPGDLPHPGIKPRSPALQANSLPSEPPGKPKNTRMGRLSLLQQIFLTQESTWDFLHCRQILYQLSSQGTP